MILQAKKKQVLLDEAYVSAVSELRLVLSSAIGGSLSKKSSQARKFVCLNLECLCKRLARLC